MPDAGWHQAQYDHEHFIKLAIRFWGIQGDRMTNQSEEERLLVRVDDALGSMQVVEVGDYRFLEFGVAAEQSCVFMPDPVWLEYDYTRAMLLGGLCHAAPESALFLGLGAGTLVLACLRYLPLYDIEIIELRPEVYRLATEWLGFADDERFTVRFGDALALLPSVETADLIFVDLYTDQGPCSAHLAWGFLEQCQQKLNPDGWLIINQWATTNGQPLGAALLRGLFHRHYWECPVKEGNVILLIPASLDQQLDLHRLRQKVEDLNPQLGYTLNELLSQVRPAT